MQLPVDPAKMKKVAEEVLGEIESSIVVNVYVDSTCNEKLVKSIEAHLNTASDAVQLNFIDLAQKKLHMELEPDFAIVLAGEDKYSVLTYAALQIKDVPALIICLDPHCIIDAAKSNDVAVRKCDVICPSYKTYTWVDNNGNKTIDFSDYNSAMDLSIKRKFSDWLYIYSEAVQISYATHFPFLRSAISRRVINACSIENAGVGALKILPGADMPIMTLNQGRMIMELAAIYGYSISVDRLVEIVVLVLSAFGLRALSNYINDEVPIPEFIVDAVFGFGGTQLLGYAAREYFAYGLAPDGLVEKCKNLLKK